jgi:hypothetical protein
VLSEMLGRPLRCRSGRAEGGPAHRRHDDEQDLSAPTGVVSHRASPPDDLSCTRSCGDVRGRSLRRGSRGFITRDGTVLRPAGHSSSG